MMKHVVSKLLIVCLILVNLASMPLGASASEAKQEFVAEQVASTNIPRGVSKPVVVNGKIYFIGGADRVNPDGVINSEYYIASNAVEVYDPIADTWEIVSSMNYPRSQVQVMVVNDKIYAIGGYTNDLSNKVSKKVEVYDPETDVWTELMDAPVGFTYRTGIADENKIYFFGSRDAFDQIIETSYVYDTDTNNWNVISDFPAELSATNFALNTFYYNDKIYVQMLDGRLFEYNILTDSYEFIGTFSFSYQYTRENGEIVVLEGSEYQIFDPNTLSTTLFALSADSNKSTIVGYTSNQLVAIGDVIYTITGCPTGTMYLSDDTVYSNVYASKLHPISTGENFLYILLGVGDTVDLTIFTLPSGMKYTDIQTWTSGNMGIATVNSTGTVTGISEGVTTITVNTPDGWTDFARVKVIDTSTNDPQTKHLAIDLPIGETVTLVVADSIGENEVSGLTWTSSNPSVVEVTNSGEITARSSGYTTIKVETPDGEWEAVIMVRVY